MNKPKKRKGKIIFIDGKDEIRLERSDAYLKDEHIKRMASAYWNFKDEKGFSKIRTCKDILEKNNGDLSVRRYVEAIDKATIQQTTKILIDTINADLDKINTSTNSLLSSLESLGIKS